MPAVCVLTGVAMTVAAATAFTAVPSGADPHHGERVRCDTEALRKAIKQANLAGGGELELAEKCTYTLNAADNDNNGLPVITSRIIIEGQKTTIRRNTGVGTPEFRIFQISGPKGDLTLKQLTIRDGRAPVGTGGGGILLTNSSSKLTLDCTTVTQNFTTGVGGGIENLGGTLTVRNSTISNNHARFSGGIDSDDAGTATIWNSKLDGNTATFNIGGIFIFRGTITFNKSLVTNNTAGASGGGIFAEDTKVTLNDTTVSGNTVLGATNPPSFTSGVGGGIYNTDHSTLIVNKSEIFANKAVGPGGQGGGITNDQGSTATLKHSSVTRNVSFAPPAGIFNHGGTVTLRETRVAENTPGNCATSVPPVTGCHN